MRLKLPLLTGLAILSGFVASFLFSGTAFAAPMFVYHPGPDTITATGHPIRGTATFNHAGTGDFVIGLNGALVDASGNCRFHLSIEASGNPPKSGVTKDRSFANPSECDKIQNPDASTILDRIPQNITILSEAQARENNPLPPAGTACPSGMTWNGNLDTCQREATAAEEKAEKCKVGSYTPPQRGGRTPAMCHADPVAKASNSDAVQCQAESLGWIICPVVRFMNTAIGYIGEKLGEILFVTPLTLPKGASTTSPYGAIFTIWQGMRNVANVLFVLFFMFAIFSVASSMGMSNYSLKKMLPKVIITAIAINLSYYICAFAIDIFNILGAGIIQLMNGAVSSIPPPPGVDPSSFEGGASGIFFLAGGLTILATAAITGVAAAVLFPLVATILLALVVIWLVLLAREVLIIFLIILSPFAFALWLLPNTEEYLKKWWTFFRNMLFMYPLAVGLFAAGGLGAHVILSTASTSGGDQEWEAQVAALAVQVLPLFALPFLLKASGGVLARIGAIGNDRGKGLIDRARNKGQEIKGTTSYQRGKAIRKQARDSRRTGAFASRIKDGTGAYSKYTRGVAGGIPITKGQRADKDQLSYAAYAQARKDRGEKIGNAANELTDANFFSNLSKFAVEGDNGQMIDIGSNKRGASLALGAGRAVTVEDVNGKKKTFKASSDNYLQYAALNDIARTGDAGGIDAARRIASGATDAEAMKARQIAPGVDLDLNAAVAKGGDLKELAQSFGSDVNNVISENGGNLVGKMPDLIKGNFAAFNAPSAAEVAAWHPSTVQRAGEYVKALEKTDPEQATKVSGMIRTAFEQAMQNSNLSGGITPQAIKNIQDAGIITRERMAEIQTGAAPRTTPTTPTPPPGPPPSEGYL